MEKIVNFCPNGSEPTRENSLVPVFTNELIEDICRAYDEDLITLVHVHARDKNGKPSSKVEDFAPIIEGIRKHCPDLSICASLSGRYGNTFESRSEVLDLNPDMGSLTMSSWNYRTGVNINSPSMILQLLDKMNSLNIVPEIECFDAGMLNYTNYLISKGLLKGPFYINMILGNLSNAQADQITVDHLLNYKPKDSYLCLGGIGKSQFKVIPFVLENADGIRLGLEDNIHDEYGNKVTNQYLLNNFKNCLNGNFKIKNPLEFKKWLKHDNSIRKV